MTILFPFFTGSLEFMITLSRPNSHSNSCRGMYAAELLKLMKEHTPKIVEEGIMFSNELIRIAISWNEQWHEALEKARSAAEISPPR